MKNIIIPIQEELNIFEKNLKKVILKEDNFLTNDLFNFMFNNPKRLRPIFVFAFAKILNINDDLVQKIALISELIHCASLIHDDIIDEEEIRRQHPTFHKKFGSKIAVLEGDLLLSMSLEEISKTTLEISKIFANKIKETILGEINQNENTNQITNLEAYYEKTQSKTGNLFMAGLEALLSIKETNEKLKNNLINFLKNYTLAFQIKNDIDNFKLNSTDFKNGNYTLPVIYFFMENKTVNFNQKSDDFQKFIEKSFRKVEEIKNQALKHLENIDNHAYKTLLIELTNYTLRS